MISRITPSSAARERRGVSQNEQNLFSQFALVNLSIAWRVITPAG
jgi:hypothetical protein